MKEHNFGGDWTQKKLERVRKYLGAYTRIFASNPRAKTLKPVYVDAFAGSGYRTESRRQTMNAELFPELSDPESQAFRKGSARIALEVDPPFKGYLFVEQDPDFTCELLKLKQEFPEKASIIDIIESDSNEYLKKWCAETDWNVTRAVVFLDPYGMQVNWELIEAIAATKAIDLWILFPIGMAVNRLLTTGGLPPEEWQGLLTRMFGTREWESAFYDTHATGDLFGEVTQKVKHADFRKIGQFFVSRLKTIFAGVSERPLPLMNSKNIPLFLLCFAAGNPRGASTAIKIANHILKE